MDHPSLLGSPLARKLTTYVVLLSLVATLTGTALQLYLSYRQNMEQITDGFDLIETSFLDSLVASVWVYNDKQIVVQLNGMLGVLGIEQAHIKIRNQIIWSAGDIISGSTIEKKFELIHLKENRNKHLGTLFVTIGLDHINKRLLGDAGIAIMISAIMVFFVAGSLLFMFRNLVTRHMTVIAHFVNTIGLEEEGTVLHLSRRSPPDNKKDEFDYVVDSINNMRKNLLLSIQNLHLSEEKIRDSESRYRSLFEDCPISLWEEDFSAVKKHIDQLQPADIHDLRTYFANHPEFVKTCAQLVQIRDVNRQTLTLLEADSKEEILNNLETVFVERTYEAFKENLIGLTEGKQRIEFQTINKTLKGHEIHILLQLTVVPDHEETWDRIFVALTDVTERMDTETKLAGYHNHLEMLVEQRTEELQEKTAKVEDSRKALTFLLEDVNESREDLEKVNEEFLAANRELKEFAYIVSHDLKAPLRAISQLTHWISEDYSELFKAEGREQMGLILQRVKRMDGLIDGILQYSRIGRMKEKEEPLDLNIFVREVTESIAPPDTIQILFEGKLPVVVRDPTRMGQVFQNLIGNAIKYMDKDEGIIKVGCTDEGTYWKFSVSDNGPGIDQRYHDKIFQIFQTLTSRDEHESTGIGLTLVKKIITLYGGSVWVESEKGAGATFFFTLTKQGEDDEEL